MNNTCTNYFDTYNSKSVAWEQCQDIYWMFVMLDDSGYSNSAESVYTLRQYACNLAHNHWDLLYADLREATKIVEKAIAKRQYLNTVRRKVSSLIDRNQSLAEIKPIIFNSLKLAESGVNLYISAARAAAIAATYALKLGESHIILAENLRNLIGNPYLITPNNTISRNWWVELPKATNIIQSIRFSWNRMIVEAESYEQRRDFNNFLNQCASLAEVWSSCPNPNWILAMIDLYTSNGDIPQLQNKLRKFACWAAKYNKTNQIWNKYLKAAVQVAEQVADNTASLKDLKVVEIVAVESVQNSLKDLNTVIGKAELSVQEREWLEYRSALLALSCTSFSAWDAVLEILKESVEELSAGDKGTLHLIQAVKLRELIENPFV